MPPCGALGDDAEGRGPEPPPPSDSDGPGGAIDPRYNKPGTSIRAMTPPNNKNGISTLPVPSERTFSRATPTRIASNDGKPRDANETRTQKCDRFCRPEPTAIQSATKPSSKGTPMMTALTTASLTLPER